LAGGVSRSISADADADAAAAEAARLHDQAADRVRALYMTGGAAALYASVLDAGSAADAMQRVAYVQRLVGSGTAESRAGDATTAALRDRAARLERAADARAVTAAQVQERYEVLLDALAQAQAELASLSDRARRLEKAQELAARIAALNAAVDATGAQRVATARASVVPPAFKRLYVDAARTCSGMSWTLLAAVGQVESGHGANTNTSYAGAQGPMQFMPATFAAYAVDGDRDGDKDIHDPADAVFSAAHYLCANGAGRGGQALERAIWHYNHAEWYVQLVLKLAGQYGQRDGL
jgi:soluble lytic murein transglycosylase-like protein